MVDISSNNYFSFIKAIENEHINIIKQLYEWYSNIIKDNLEIFFKTVCHYNNLILVKLFYNWYPINIESIINDEIIFKYVCEKGYIDLLDQIYKWCPNVITHFHNIFKNL